jgi:CheY-like chemotaxis protein
MIHDGCSMTKSSHPRHPLSVDGRALALVIEPDTAKAAALVLALEDLGFGVQVAANDGRAVRMAETTRPDIVLIDLMHAEQWGRQELRELRALTAGEVPVVAFSYAEESAVQPDNHDAFDPYRIAESAAAAIAA